MQHQKDPFIESRRHKIQTFRYAGFPMIALCIGTYIWLLFRVPFLANPFHTIYSLREGKISYDIMYLATSFLPILTALVFGLLLAMILFTFAAFRNEKKYIEYIDENCRD